MTAPADRLFDGVWFGPVGSPPGGADAVLAEIVEQCKVGDFRRRPELVELLGTKPPLATALDAQRLLLATATDAQLRDEETLSYLTDTHPEVIVELMGSAVDMLGVASVPLMLSAHEAATEVSALRELVVDGLETLLGLDLRDVADRPTAELAAAISATVDALEAPLLRRR